MKKNVLFTRCTESHVHSGTRHMSTVTQCPTYIRKVSALASVRCMRVPAPRAVGVAGRRVPATASSPLAYWGV